jgi:hypothetical protein
LLGPPGTPATVSVGTTTTGASGTAASVTNSGTSSAAILNFTIPQGPQGATGTTGPQGPPVSFKGSWSNTTVYNVGAAVSFNGSSYIALTNNFNVAPGSDPTTWALLAQAGTNGTNGTAATVSVGTTATGAPGTAASVINSGTSSAAVLNFTIPQGPQGVQGIQGVPGAPGSQGPPVSFKGAWSSATVYNVGAAVSFNGSSYIALTSNLAIQPGSDPTTWALLAQAGTSASFKGAWSSAIVYNVGDAVSFNGSSYIALTSNLAVQPGSDPTTWALLAQAGTAATVSVGTTATGAPGTAASVTNSGTSSAALLNFTIPQGFPGPPGATGATGPQGPAGANGASLVSPWSSSTIYNIGTLVTYNNSLFVALTSNLNVTPSSGANGTWAGIAMGTGASPGGIPYTIGVHDLQATTTPEYVTPAGNGNSSNSLGVGNTVITPIPCTPSMTIYSLGSTGGQFDLLSVLPISTAATGWSPGSTVMSCTAGSSSGGVPQLCSVTSPAPVLAGTVLTLQATPVTLPTFPAVFYTAFSCY